MPFHYILPSPSTALQKTQEKLLYLHHPNPLWNTSRADFSMNFTSKLLIYKWVENLQAASYKGASMVILWKLMHIQ